jgi:nucleoid-associated protein YgaU
VSLAVNFIGRKFAEAQLEIVEPPEMHTVINLKFNPAEYKLTKENNFAEVPLPGLESPPLQYVRGGARVLSMDLLADTSDELKDVRDEYVKPLENAQLKNTKLHAPPILAFMWAGQVFKGVLTSLDVTYTLFHIDGKPLRAKLAVKLKEYLTVQEQQRKREGTSPDVEKRYVVRTGETLSSIAAAVYRDPALWRKVADANRITDPRSLTPGTVLTVPRLEEKRR